MKNRPLVERLGVALAGLSAGWRRERSFRTQIVLAGFALAALVILRPAPIWWAVVALAGGLVVLLELVNASIEGVVDLLHPGLHPEVKAIKDMMAGAVLLASIVALLVGTALIVDRWAFIVSWWEWVA